MIFHRPSEHVLKQADKPFTANEIWQLAIGQGLDEKLNSSGRTPWATLGTRLYVISRDNPDLVLKQLAISFSLPFPLWNCESENIDTIKG